MSAGTKVAHTAGPWTLDDPGVDDARGMVEGIMVIADNAPAGSKLVAECMSPVRMEADAHLIAAAPDLLAALENAVVRIRSQPCCGDVTEGFCFCPNGMAKRQALDAIAKARGAA